MTPALPPAPTPVVARPADFASLFMPKLVTVLKEGYGSGALRRDVMSGLTVAIVALPLSIAIATASGATPMQGLTAAIVGGFLVSALGGSRYQIGGPAGAFIVLVSAAIAEIGVEGTVLAVLLSGGMLALAGWLRLGAVVKYIPYPVTVGFTSGIAVIIAFSQLREGLGLTLSGPEPGPTLEKLSALVRAAATADGLTAAMAVGTMGLIFALKRWRPGWPGILIAVAAATAFAAVPGVDVATVTDRFGTMPHGLPAPGLPTVTPEKLSEAFPFAVSFTLLGAIESLLSAVVADGMTGRRHRSNCELVAQGAANIGSALFGGLPVTGTIARTATNIRAGAHGPVSGMMHSLFVLGMLVVGAPLISAIPMAALSGVLLVVAWNMMERDAFVRLVRSSRGDAAVLLATFALTVFRDLTEAILVGFALGSVLFIHRMSQAARVELGAPLVQPDAPDEIGRAPSEAPAGVVVCRISGAFFFGAAAAIGSALDRTGGDYRLLVIDFSETPFIDSTGVHTIEGLIAGAHRRNAAVWITGASPPVREALERQGVAPPGITFAGKVSEALAAHAGEQPGGV